ncbi:hypothetical protein [Mucilaginibacter xinganensis]|uniref:Uncharacterized protein n=1 Tax=Mucilaginibacter xinganensis TaxID=1234841 RepID=A0A223NW88_9SPHI|nr:hypothetical protein [Mucilaginibacter xinganensis]ASU34142.1 hypothetical protein MuYL_2253 [Mucilaginibacter xinganensis]
MKTLKLLSAIFLLAVIASCSKNNPVAPVKPITPTGTKDVYVAGAINNVATIWKNGAATALKATGMHATTAVAVCIKASDVYVAGNGYDASNNSFAILWKNGSATLYAKGTIANSLSVDAAGTVFVAGTSTIQYQSNSPYPYNGTQTYQAATLWTNGTAKVLTDGNKAFYDNNAKFYGGEINRNAGATSVYAGVTGAYVSGWEFQGAYGQESATLWNNKNKLALYNSIGGNYQANEPYPGLVGKFFGGDTAYIIPPTFSLISLNQASSVFVDAANNVYAAGYVTQGNFTAAYGATPPPHKATLWKNGIATRLGDSTVYANPQSIYVSGADVYVAGMSISKDAKNEATLWKNGVAAALSTNTSNAASVFVAGTDVYVAGITYNGTIAVATIWKNGIATVLIDGAQTAYANAVFVVNGIH